MWAGGSCQVHGKGNIGQLHEHCAIVLVNGASSLGLKVFTFPHLKVNLARTAVRGGNQGTWWRLMWATPSEVQSSRC